MGTTIRLEFVKGKATTKKQWNTLLNFLDEEGIFYEEEDDLLYTVGPVFCTYSGARASEFLLDICDELIGSGLVVNLWYEERDPDDTYCFEERQ